MEEYSREELLHKLEELVNQSEFISKGVITTWEHLADIEDLKKLIVLTHDSLEQEKNLSEEEKDDLSKKIIDINYKKISIYKNFEKKARQEDELNQKNSDEIDIDKELLNI